MLFAGWIVVILCADNVAIWLTPFASTWVAWSAQLLRAVVTCVVIGAALVLLALCFTAVTLVVGAPVYERLSATLDHERGRPAVAAPGNWSTVMMAAGIDSIATLGYGLALLLPAAVLSLIPIIGQIGGVVAGTVIGSWLVVMEVIQPAAEHRGLTRLHDRRVLLRRARARTLGFGLPVYLLLLIPVLGIVVYPCAIIGATMLVDDLERQFRGWPAAPEC
ncbi:MAG: EI24 domain-containing protein [Propionibacteriaceae bacterium]